MWLLLTGELPSSAAMPSSFDTAARCYAVLPQTALRAPLERTKSTREFPLPLRRIKVHSRELQLHESFLFINRPVRIGYLVIKRGCVPLVRIFRTLCKCSERRDHNAAFFAAEIHPLVFFLKSSVFCIRPLFLFPGEKG